MSAPPGEQLRSGRIYLIGRANSTSADSGTGASRRELPSGDAGPGAAARILPAAVLLAAALLLPPSAAVGGGTAEPEMRPLYRIALRVHLEESGRRREEFDGVFAEINRIWRSQAGICFAIEPVDRGGHLPGGLDLWFQETLGGYNGYFSGPHSIRVRDFPDLAPAPHPSSDPAARTAAHELGHALGLPHRQESDDNLMRSKTYGWALGAGEVAVARRTAAAMALSGDAHSDCEPSVPPAPNIRR